MERKPKIHVGIPCQHNVDTIVRFEHDKIVQSSFDRFDIDVEAYENFDRDDARNRMAEKTVRSEFDFLFMVDDDMILPDNCLVNLYDSFTYSALAKIGAIGVVGGLYCSWGKNHQQHCYDYIPNQKEFKKRFKQNRVEPNTGIYERNMVGAGCCLIESWVFSKIETPWFSFQYQGNERLGEDNSFFEKCYLNNIPVCINSDVVCTHLGKFGVKPMGIDSIEVVNLA